MIVMMYAHDEQIFFLYDTRATYNASWVTYKAIIRLYITIKSYNLTIPQVCCIIQFSYALYVTPTRIIGFIKASQDIRHLECSRLRRF